MSEGINRLGFDSWASNLAVNLIENGELKDGYRFECDLYSISVKSLVDFADHQFFIVGGGVRLAGLHEALNAINEKHLVVVRAYVAGSGWQTSEITY